jgi:hypothetical protein
MQSTKYEMLSIYVHTVFQNHHEELLGAESLFNTSGMSQCVTGKVVLNIV